MLPLASSLSLSLSVYLPRSACIAYKRTHARDPVPWRAAVSGLCESTASLSLSLSLSLRFSVSPCGSYLRL